MVPVAPPPLVEMTVYLTPDSMYTVSVPLKFSVATHSSEMFETVRLWFSRLTVATSMRLGPQIRQLSASRFMLPNCLLVRPVPVLTSAPMPLKPVP